MVCFPYVKQPDDYIYSHNLIHCKRRDLNQRPFSNSRFFFFHTGPRWAMFFSPWLMSYSSSSLERYGPFKEFLGMTCGKLTVLRCSHRHPQKYGGFHIGFLQK